MWQETLQDKSSNKHTLITWDQWCRLTLWSPSCWCVCVCVCVFCRIMSSGQLYVPAPAGEPGLQLLRSQQACYYRSHHQPLGVLELLAFQQFPLRRHRERPALRWVCQQQNVNQVHLTSARSCWAYYWTPDVCIKYKVKAENFLNKYGPCCVCRWEC